MNAMFEQFAAFMAAKEAAKTAEKAKPGPKPGKKAELEALRAELAALRGEPAIQAANPTKVQAAKVESADYSAVWTALKGANLTHYGVTVKASSWAAAQLKPIFGAAFSSVVGESKKGSTQWDKAIEAGKAAELAATPAVLSAAAKIAGVDFAKLVG
jgi:hypothetical protein